MKVIINQNKLPLFTTPFHYRDFNVMGSLKLCFLVTKMTVILPSHNWNTNEHFTTSCLEYDTNQCLFVSIIAIPNNSTLPPVACKVTSTSTRTKTKSITKEGTSIRNVCFWVKIWNCYLHPYTLTHLLPHCTDWVLL